MLQGGLSDWRRYLKYALCKCESSVYVADPLSASHTLVGNTPFVYKLGRLVCHAEIKKMGLQKTMS